MYVVSRILSLECLQSKAVVLYHTQTSRPLMTKD